VRVTATSQAPSLIIKKDRGSNRPQQAATHKHPSPPPHEHPSLPRSQSHITSYTLEARHPLVAPWLSPLLAQCSTYSQQLAGTLLEVAALFTSPSSSPPLPPSLPLSRTSLELAALFPPPASSPPLSPSLSHLSPSLSYLSRVGGSFRLAACVCRIFAAPTHLG
jgi:hypothetical protein